MGQNEGSGGWEKMEIKNRKIEIRKYKNWDRKSKKMGPKIKKIGLGGAGRAGRGRGKWEEKE
jgi:hypothetical protein